MSGSACPAPPTTADCFASYLLPWILFEADAEVRRKTAITCCLAWNISLFPDNAQRDDHIERTWTMVKTDSAGVPPPSGAEQGFKQELRAMVVRKQALFPCLRIALPHVELISGVTTDRLLVTCDGTTEERPLVFYLSPQGLPLIIAALKRLHNDTAAQWDLVKQAQRVVGALDDVLRTRLERFYAQQRADLMVYGRILEVWQQVVGALSPSRVIRHWRGVVDDIDGLSRAILRTL